MTGSQTATTDAEPSAECQGLVFLPIPEFDLPTENFGAEIDSYFDRHNLPDIPREFRDLAATLFFKGGELPKFRPEVSRAKAHIALNAWLMSFAPAHESKMATVAYALWVWTHGVKTEA